MANWLLWVEIAWETANVCRKREGKEGAALGNQRHTFPNLKMSYNLRSCVNVQVAVPPLCRVSPRRMTSRTGSPCAYRMPASWCMSSYRPSCSTRHLSTAGLVQASPCLPHWPCLLEKAGLHANHLLFLWGFRFVLLFALTCLGVLRICVSPSRHGQFSELLLTECESRVTWFESRMKWAWGILASLAGDWQAIELVVWVLVVLSPARWSRGNNNHPTLWGSKGRKISLSQFR